MTKETNETVDPISAIFRVPKVFVKKTDIGESNKRKNNKNVVGSEAISLDCTPNSFWIKLKKLG